MEKCDHWSEVLGLDWISMEKDQAHSGATHQEGQVQRAPCFCIPTREPPSLGQVKGAGRAAAYVVCGGGDSGSRQRVKVHALASPPPPGGSKVVEGLLGPALAQPAWGLAWPVKRLHAAEKQQGLGRKDEVPVLDEGSIVFGPV